MAFSSVLPVILALAVCLSAAAAEYPGFMGRMTQKGLNYFSQEGMSVLPEELAKLDIPDFSGSTKGFLWNIDYTIFGMNIESLQLPRPHVRLVPKHALMLSIPGASIKFNGNWRFKNKFHMSSSGGFDAIAEGVKISVGLKMGSDSMGIPNITPYDLSCQVSNVQSEVSGNLGWLINFFQSHFNNILKKAIESQLSPLVQKTISKKLEPVLLKLPVIAKIDEIAAIDYSLLDPPLVTADYMDVQVKGEVFQLSQRTTPPFSPRPLSLPIDQNHMVYFGVSDYFFNSAGFAYHSSGILDFTVMDDMIPKDYDVQLNTESFSKLIPRLSKMYPNMLMRLKISPTSAPTVSIKPGQANIFAAMDLQAYVRYSNGALIPAFLLNLTVSAPLTASVNSGKLVINVQQSRVQLGLKRSDVGPFSVDVLNDFMNDCISDILLPRVYGFLNKGYPLPILDNMEPINVIIEPRENFLLIEADIDYY